MPHSWPFQLIRRERFGWHGAPVDARPVIWFHFKISGCASKLTSQLNTRHCETKLKSELSGATTYAFLWSARCPCRSWCWCWTYRHTTKRRKASASRIYRIATSPWQDLSQCFPLPLTLTHSHLTPLTQTKDVRRLPVGERHRERVRERSPVLPYPENPNPPKGYFLG